MKRLTKSERRKQIRRFDAIRDDQINTTDIPEITEEQMRKGVVGHLYRPIKRPVTMRLDANVIAMAKTRRSRLPDEGKPALAAGNAEISQSLAPGKRHPGRLLPSLWTTYGIQCHCACRRHFQKHRTIAPDTTTQMREGSSTKTQLGLTYLRALWSLI